MPFVGTKENPKLFFFVAQEYYEQQTSAANPTNTACPRGRAPRRFFADARRDGKLVVIRDPLTGLPFPGNVIPTSRSAQGMKALMASSRSRAPRAGRSTTTLAAPRDIPRRKDIARIDWQIASGTRLSARYIHNKDEDVQPLGTTTAAFNFRLAETRSCPRTVRAAPSRPPSPLVSPSLINEFVYGAGRGGVYIGPVALSDVTRARYGVTTRSSSRAPIPATPSRASASSESRTRRARPPASRAAARRSRLQREAVRPALRDQQLHQQPDKVRARTCSRPGTTTSAPTTSAPRSDRSSRTWCSERLHPSLEHGHPSRTRSRRLQELHAGAGEDHQQLVYQDISFYAQDTWKVKSNLTLDYGLANRTSS